MLRLQSYGVYLSYYLSNQKYPEARAIDFAFIGGLNFAVAMLVAPLVTGIVHRYEIHLPMSLGILMFGIAYISASFSHRIWQLYLSQGGLVGSRGRFHLYSKHCNPISMVFLKTESCQ
jgi:hypothetical protein